MKKSFVWIAGFALAVSSLPLLAQETLDGTTTTTSSPTTAANTKNKGQEMKKEKPHGPFAALDLTPEQREKIKSIMESGKTEREALEKEREALKQKAEAFREQQMEKIKAVLTPEQIKKFDEMKDKMKEKMEGAKGHFGGKGPFGGKESFQPGDAK